MTYPVVTPLECEYERMFWRTYPMPKGLDENEREEYAAYVRRQAKEHAAADERTIGPAPSLSAVEARMAALVAKETTGFFGSGYRSAA